MTGRIADIAFAMNQEYVGSRDLLEFSNRVEELFSWYEGRKEYIAPYFPIVQSSGMGKTKIMVEYRNQIMKKSKSQRSVVIILCTSSYAASTENSNVYDGTLKIDDDDRTNDISSQLDELVNNSTGKCQEVVFFV